MARRARSSKAKGPKKRDTKDPKPEKKENVPDNVKEEAVGPVKGSGKKEVPKKDAAPVEDTKKGALREWYDANKTTIFILLGIFVFAFLIREFFYYQISFNSWPPNIVGNDPSYHKRVIDFVQSDFQHIKIDPLLNYPISGGNPRPPIFDWSIAVTGIVLSPFFGFNVENSTWFVFQFAPTFWGALTIFPMYLLGKETFGKRAGIMAAFFLAITASHIERSTLGFTDHDSFIVFFLVLSMYFLAKAFSVQRDKNYISDWRKSDSVILGFKKFAGDNREALLYAFLTGLSISTIALTWQGFAYVLAILLIYYLIQLLLHRFRNEDSLGTFIVIFIAMGTVVFLSLPYYFIFSITIWSQGFYILLAMTVLGVFIVPTRDIPWLLVIPTLGIFLIGSYFVLQWGFPDTADLLFTGGGYFTKSKLYSTIAEAQAPDISRVVFTYGPATFFLGLIGVVMALIKIPKQMRKDYIVIVVWTAVAIYMALSAIRFNFNATPAFALLAGWVIVKIVEYFKAEGLSIVYSLIAVSIFILGLFVISEGWDTYLSRNYFSLTILPVIAISLAFFGFMKYRRKREYFKFRKILVALGVGFLVMLPNLFFAIDASIPIESKRDFDPELEYLGSFGSSLHSEYWMDSYEWLATQDLMDGNESIPPEDRPAFMSWWDYGFDQLLLGKHPTAADNFQNGYQFTGSMIASQNESEAIALMASRLLEGDWIENKQQFSDEVWDILVNYLGDNRNSSTSAYEMERIYHKPGNYIDTVTNNPGKYGPYDGITWQNARYAAARGAMMHLGEEEIVNLYRDVREATGKSLRYFAVDYRLFPFSASNTGIFYAPITLADRDVEDYLEYRVYAQENTRGSNEDPMWQDYPDNPIPMEKAREESERLGYKFRIVETDMFYTDLFYNSLFYRTYIGFTPQDVGATNDGKSIPGFPGELQSLPPMQAWNMTHWKLVYRTMYYSDRDEANSTFPDDYEPMESQAAMDLYRDEGGDVKSGLGQGVFYIMYYDGAIAEGQVKTTRGVGAPGLRVTVLDEYGIPHGNVVTGPNGEYKLIIPPGDVNLVVTEGPLENQYDKLYQFQIDQSTGQPVSLLNSTILQISDDLAMRRVDDGKLHQDLLIPGRRIAGNIYWDLNQDSTYTPGDDELIQKGEITYELLGSEGKVYGPYSLDEDGAYRLEDLVPGRYDIIYTFGDRRETLISDYKVDLQGESTKDIRIDNTIIGGNVNIVSGFPAQGLGIILTDAEGQETQLITDVAGNYSVDKLFPGIYTIKADHTSFTHEEVKFEVGQGENLTFNITLLPRGDLSLKVNYPLGHSYGSGSSNLVVTPVSGGILKLIDNMDPSRTWTKFLDEKGELQMELPEGSYDLHIQSMDRDNYWAFIDTIDINWKEETKQVLTMERGIRINGTLTKLVGTGMNNTEILFTRESDGAVAHVFSNSMGEYNCYLPKGDYSVKVDNTTYPGNVTYFHMQDLIGQSRDNHVQLDIKASKTAKISGRVFWDKDGDRVFTDFNEANNRASEEDPPAAEVGLEELAIEFTYSNGSISTRTGLDGEFDVYLPPGEYMMKVLQDGFYPFTREVFVENSAEVLNFGLNETDAPLDARERQVQMNMSLVFYGKDDIDIDPASNIPYTIMSRESHTMDLSYGGVTGSDGIVTISLPPGEYSVDILEEILDEDLIHTLTLGESLFVEPSSDIMYMDGYLEHMVKFDGTMFLQENSITRYPAEVSVNFNAIQGERVTIIGAETDFNGKFHLEAPAGEYILEVHQERPGTHYMHWDVVSVGFGIPSGEFEMTPGIPVEGSISPAFNDIGDSEIFFMRDGIWTSAEIESDGDFSTIVFPGTYDVEYAFFTLDQSFGDDIQVQYYHNSQVEINEPYFGLGLDLSINVEMRGAVYHDENDDRTIQPHERREGVNITFTPVNGGEPTWTISDPNGDFAMMVPFTKLEISIDAEGYRTSPRSDVSVIDLPTERIALWDIPLVPEDIPVQGILFFDENNNGEWDDDEGPAPGVKMTFTSINGDDFEVTSGSDGSFNIGLLPDLYNVFGMKYSQGRPVMGYLSELNLDMGEDVTDQQWAAVPARRVSGTVFYRNTDGELFLDPTDGDDIDFHGMEGGDIYVSYSDGTYTVDLPYYDYYITSSIVTEEFGIDISYRLTKSLTFNDSTPADEMSMELEKQKEFNFQVDLVRVFEHEVEMGAKQTVRLEYYIENVGNEKFTVDMSTSDKPDSWIVEFPLGQDIELDIGERVTRWVNITSPADPDFTNSMILQGESDQGTKNTFQVQIKTPSSFKFDLLFDIPDVLGVNYNELRVFNLTVDNIGNGEDVVNVHFTPTPDQVEDWGIEWEGSPEFPEEGINASLLPKGVRRYAITVRTPEGDENSFYDEDLVLTFTGKNRLGDVVKKQVKLEVRKPNLVLPPGFLKLTNRRLEDPVLNKTIEANITVKSLYRDVRGVNVTLKIDDDIVGEGIIPYIPQDGTGSARIRFNITDWNITEDEFHKLEVFVDPYDNVQETDDFDNAGIWTNVVIGQVPESELEINWRIIIFIALVIVVALGIIAYRQKTQPI